MWKLGKIRQHCLISWKISTNIWLFNWNIEHLLNWAVELLLSWMIEWHVALYFPKLETNWGTSVRRQVHRKRLIKIWKLPLCQNIFLCNDSFYFLYTDQNIFQKRYRFKKFNNSTLKIGIRQVQRKRLIKIWKLLPCQYILYKFSLSWYLIYFFVMIFWYVSLHKIYLWKDIVLRNSTIPL